MESVAAEQSARGVKDPVAQYWIEQIVAKATAMREQAEQNPSDDSLPRTDEEIIGAVVQWLAEQPGEHLHPLLRWSGTPMLCS